jgi:outer membrane protein OmpA-like peptidoglycan-associated protein
MRSAMSQRFVLMLAVMCSGSLAHAGNGTRLATTPCEQDPKFYARDLALTLTREPPTVVMQRVVEFEPGRVRVYSKSREKIQAIAETWKWRANWSVITVDGYGASAQGDDVDLGQRRAEKIRAYFIRYGVPAEDVVAVGHADEPGTAATVGLSIDLCTRESPCARGAASTAEAATAAR